MTSAECLSHVEALGFTSREAGFLAHAALHSGYFIRRQYADWLQVAMQSAACMQLPAKLVSRRFARSIRLPGAGGYLYHLHGRRLYEALGDENNFNQCRAPVSKMLGRLQTLDFVLAHRHYTFYPTAQDKLRVSGEYGIPSNLLPTRVHQAHGPRERVRYFSERAPLFQRPDSPAMWVAYAWSGRRSEAFRRFLLRYLPFLEAFAHTGVVAIQRRGLSPVCAQVFDSVVRDRVLRHFSDRATWERGDLVAFPTERVWRLRQDEVRYGSEQYQALYRRRQIEGDAAVVAQGEASAGVASDEGLPAFETYELPHNYRQFGVWGRY
jgi:hypothetical protein